MRPFSLFEQERTAYLKCKKFIFLVCAKKFWLIIKRSVMLCMSLIL